MKIIDDDKRGTPWMAPFAAKKDLLRRDEENRPSFSAEQLALAGQLVPLVSAAHPNGRTWPPNCRATMITVKAENYRSRDKLSPEFTALELFCTANGIVATFNAGSSAIYSINKV